MIYKYNEQVSVESLSSLRESVGWNRMESYILKEGNLYVWNM